MDGIERHAFILPREKILDSEGNETDIPVDMINHVLPEFMQIARSKGIKKHQCKPTSRKYMYHFEVFRTCPHAENGSLRWSKSTCSWMFALHTLPQLARTPL